MGNALGSVGSAALAAGIGGSSTGLIAVRFHSTDLPVQVRARSIRARRCALVVVVFLLSVFNHDSCRMMQELAGRCVTRLLEFGGSTALEEEDEFAELRGEDGEEVVNVNPLIGNTAEDGGIDHVMKHLNVPLHTPWKGARSRRTPYDPNARHVHAVSLSADPAIRKEAARRHRRREARREAKQARLDRLQQQGLDGDAHDSVDVEAGDAGSGGGGGLVTPPRPRDKFERAQALRGHIGKGGGTEEVRKRQQRMEMEEKAWLAWQQRPKPTPDEM